MSADMPIPLTALGGGTLLRWLVKDSDSVKEDQVVAMYTAPAKMPGARPTQQQLRAPVSGKLVLVGIDTASNCAIVRVCTHPMLFSSVLCAVCGVDVSKLPRRTRAFLEEQRAASGTSTRATDAPRATAQTGTTRSAATGTSIDPTIDVDASMTWWPAPAVDTLGAADSSSSSAAVIPGMTRFQVQHGFEISLTDAHAEASDAAYADRLRASHKLSLILDLDHTLIHATAAASMTSAEPAAAGTASAGSDSAESLTVGAAATVANDVFTLSDPMFTYRVKLRPGVRAFLAAAAELFELGVDTAGTRAYALAVVKVLDPSGVLFGSRIVSRCDSRLRHKQSGAWLHRSLKDDSMVVVVDDTEGVWRGARNLLLIEPYRYWVVGTEANNAAGASVADAGAGHLPLVAAQQLASTPPAQSTVLDAADPAHAHGVLTSVNPLESISSPEVMGTEEHHAYLSDILRVLRHVHAAYYAAPSKPPPRTDDIIASMLHDVLSGCCIVFSGVFPLGIVVSKTPLWRRATLFGAVIVDTVSATTLLAPAVQSNASPTGQNQGQAAPIVTHVVARAPSGRMTSKLHEAVAAGDIRIVELSWLEESLKRYQRQPEHEHPFARLERAATVDNSVRVAAFLAAQSIASAASQPRRVAKIVPAASERNVESNSSHVLADDGDDSDWLDDEAAPVRDNSIGAANIYDDNGGYVGAAAADDDDDEESYEVDFADLDDAAADADAEGTAATSHGAKRTRY